MTPQARIMLRFVEAAAHAGVNICVAARKKSSPEFREFQFAGMVFYLKVVGEDKAGIDRFRHASILTLAGLPYHSGGSWEPGYIIPPYEVERVLVDTDVSPDHLHHNNSAALHIASEIRARAAFEDLPVLADALEEAGCANACILRHCRHSVRHDGPCWVIELLLAIANGRCHFPKK